MAGIATHLIIAREILKLLPKGTIREEGLFYAGSIAPDAIHAREGFVRKDKNHTHFRDNIPERDFVLGENLELFHQRVIGFIIKNRDRTDGLLDLYRGYVAHILTDELYMLTIRQEFVQFMEKRGIDQYDPEFIRSIITDMTRNDDLMMKSYTGMEEVKSYLENIPPYQIHDLLSEEELTISRNWVLQRYFYEEINVKEPIYITYDRTLEFIQMSVKDIITRLSQGGNLPSMW